MNKKDKAVNKKHRRNKERLKEIKKSYLLSSSKKVEKVILEKDSVKPAAKKPAAKKPAAKKPAAKKPAAKKKND
jgi:hypothetical protein